uniref:Apple domain-containing protein n=1 Tax=Macrostomum lignano TaxID=282301 RepID=A0A1I8IAV6_9PLAT
KPEAMLHSRFFMLIACSAVLLTCAVWGRVLRVSYIGCFFDDSDRDLNGLAGITAIVTSAPLEALIILDCRANNNASAAGPTVVTESPLKLIASRPCSGNSSQMCGGNWRNSVFSLTYPKMSCFKQSKMPNLTVSSTLPTSWSLAAQTALDCLILCEASADCQAVIFSGQQRLCHLLRFAYPPVQSEQHRRRLL